MAQKRKTSKPVASAPVAETTTTAEAATAEATAPAPAARKDPRLCVVAGCDRRRLDVDNVKTRLCGAHYASRRGDGG